MQDDGRRKTAFLRNPCRTTRKNEVETWKTESASAGQDICAKVNEWLTGTYYVEQVVVPVTPPFRGVCTGSWRHTESFNQQEWRIQSKLTAR